MAETSSKNAFLLLIPGPMYGGKSNFLITHITRYADLSKNTDVQRPLLINNSIDTRDPKNVISSHHSGYKGISECIDVISVSKLSQVDVTNYQVIGIDEGQFFSDLYDTVVKWLSQGKHISIAGLVGDFDQKKFGQMSELLPLANDIKFLPAVCHFCLNEYIKKGEILTPEILDIIKGPFTKKIIESKGQIDIGSTDKYLPSCRKHL